MKDLLREETQVQDQASVYYDKLRYAERFSFRYHRQLVDKMLALVAKEGKILDNGCGIGILSLLYPQRSIVGMDISLGMLLKAKPRNNNLVCADSAELPFKANTFEIIFCRSILHHLANPALAVAEMCRVLKKGGELVLMETNRSFFNDLPRKIIKRSRHFSELHRNFHRQEILSILGAKFAVEKVQHFGFLAYPLVGFPDLVNIFKYFPCKEIICQALMKLDEFFSQVPLLKTQSWGIIIKCKRKE